MKIAIINDTSSTHHFGCRLVMENLFSLLAQRGVEVIWTWPVSVDWRRHKRRMLNLPKVDAIIINGEGTIHHNTERKYAQALIDFCGFASRDLNTPCYLINATLYKNSPDAYKAISNLRAVYVRDKGSLKELNDSGLTGAYVPDLTFGRNRKYKSTQPSGICVIDSAIKEDSIYLKNYAQEHGYAFRSMIVARPGNARFLRSPRPWVKNIYQYLRSDRHISVEPSDYIQYLKQYEMVITGRYHTVTMCIKNRIPFVALESNTPKVRYLLNDTLGNASRSVPKSELENLSINSYSDFSEDEIRHIANFVENAEQAIDRMIDSILSDIRNGQQGNFSYS